MKKILASSLAALSALLVGAPHALASAPAPVKCLAPYARCIRTPDTTANASGLEIIAGQDNPGTPFMVLDKNLAPMFWCNLYGCYSGGDWGKMPGGLLCVTNGVLANAACLTPVGTLELFTKDGQSETLTPADIAWIHQQEKKGSKG